LELDFIEPLAKEAIFKEGCNLDLCGKVGMMVRTAVMLIPSNQKHFQQIVKNHQVDIMAVAHLVYIRLCAAIWLC